MPTHTPMQLDRKSTRLNSSHSQISYAVFCLKKTKQQDKELRALARGRCEGQPYRRARSCTSALVLRVRVLYVSVRIRGPSLSFFFFNDTATTEIYTLSLHDALPIWAPRPPLRDGSGPRRRCTASPPPRSEEHTSELQSQSNLVCRLLLEKKNTT